MAKERGWLTLIRWSYSTTRVPHSAPVKISKSLRCWGSISLTADSSSSPQEWPILLSQNIGSKLMLYRIRHDDGNDWLSGTWIEKLGQSRPLARVDIGLTERAIRFGHPWRS